MFALALALVIPSGRYATPEDLSVHQIFAATEDDAFEQALQLILDETGDGVKEVTLDSWFTEAFVGREDEIEASRKEFDAMEAQDKIDFIMLEAFGGDDEGFYAKVTVNEYHEGGYL
jgi:hypothetical protein